MMPLFRVPVTVWAEADDAEAARDIALNCRAGEDGHIWGMANWPEQLSAEGAAAFLEVVVQVKMALSQDPHDYVTRPEHPGLHFTPQAAATLDRLKAEAYTLEDLDRLDRESTTCLDDP